MVVRVITERLGSFDSINVNMEIASGKTVLMYAAQGGSAEIFNRLLELGADPMQADGVRAPWRSLQYSFHSMILVALMIFVLW